MAIYPEAWQHFHRKDGVVSGEPLRWADDDSLYTEQTIDAMGLRELVYSCDNPECLYGDLNEKLAELRAKVWAIEEVIRDEARMES